MNRYYTLEEAIAKLPWLEEKFSLMVPVRDELAARQEELIALLRRRRNNGHSSSEEEISQSQREVNRLTRDLQDNCERLPTRAFWCGTWARGLVDFPALRDGREVHLCWLRGEATIAYWHETNEGFPGRQPL